MKKKNFWLTTVLVSVFVAVSFAMRLLPHPYNFIPIGALALVCGTYIRSRWGILIPVAVMAISDLIIGTHNLMLLTWACFLMISMLGWWVRQHKNPLHIVGATVAGSVIFYLVTNFGVWALTPLYAKTAAGLVQCYYMAIPFFRNTALGDLFYVGVFFGLYEALSYLVFVPRQKPIRVVASSK